MRGLCTALSLAAALLVWPSVARADVIEYQAFNLGGDVWQYNYFLAGGTFTSNQGFAIFFDPDLYERLDLPPSPSGEWDILTTVPEPTLDSPGTYDALALVDLPSFTGPFSVTFTWLGLPGTPGSQPFQIYELDVSGASIPIDERGGDTIPSVPEPATLSLLALGVAAAWTRTRARHARTRSH